MANSGSVQIEENEIGRVARAKGVSASPAKIRVLLREMHLRGLDQEGGLLYDAAYLLARNLRFMPATLLQRIIGNSTINRAFFSIPYGQPGQDAKRRRREATRIALMVSTLKETVPLAKRVLEGKSFHLYAALLLANGRWLKRSDLASSCGLATGSVGKMVDRLIAEGFPVESSSATTGAAERREAVGYRIRKEPRRPMSS